MASEQNNTNQNLPDHLAETNNAKATGGGLDAGTADLGSSTAPAHGGRGAAGTDSSRTRTGSVNDTEPGGPGRAGAHGNSVTATGRPITDTNRDGIGDPALSNPDANARQQDSLPLETGGTARSAAGTSLGNRGGGAAGTGALVNDRSVDIVEGRVGGPEGNVAGRSTTPGEQAPQEPGGTNMGASADSIERARQQSSRGSG